jgi:endonuclease YncB( thermonuclease family)
LRGSLRRFTIFAGLACAAFVGFPAKAQDAAACASSLLGTFDAGIAVDGRSFKLRDGREILLAGIEVPSGAGRAALERWLTEKVTLHPVESGGDRYGRIAAHAYAAGDGTGRWIQGALLAAGQVQMGSRPGGAACAGAMRAAEAEARRNRLGLWADSAYSVKAADDFAALSARPGRFTVAEGKVLSVRESAGTIYINFGRDWSRNLTVTVLRRNRPAFEAAGMEPKKLQGARIRVRGFVELRNGPRIEAARPEQIEFAAQD